jgi:hypothetical protein
MLSPATCSSCAGSWRNMDARNILGVYGMPMLPLYNATVSLSTFHRPLKHGEGMDCTHYCHPTVPQIAIASMVTKLREARLPPLDPEVALANRAGAWGIKKEASAHELHTFSDEAAHSGQHHSRNHKDQGDVSTTLQVQKTQTQQKQRNRRLTHVGKQGA